MKLTKGLPMRLANIVYEREEDEITELENKLNNMVEKIETEPDNKMIQTLPEDLSNDSMNYFHLAKTRQKIK